MRAESPRGGIIRFSCHAAYVSEKPKLRAGEVSVLRPFFFAEERGAFVRNQKSTPCRALNSQPVRVKITHT